MKILDKVKNMFTEEVEEEVQVEQVKPTKKKKVKEIDAFDQIKEEKKKEEERKPIFFTDEDFNDMDLFSRKEEKKQEEKRKSVVKMEEKSINIDKEPEMPTLPHRNTTPYEEVKQVKKFKPTPIISPVYGILDKNYHKEDIVNKNENDYQAVDGLSVDSIRNKAYGTLEDELENTLFGNNSILFNENETKEEKEEVFDSVEEETNNDLLDELTEEQPSAELEKIDHDLDDLENITMDIGKELDSLLSKKTEENEENEDDLFDLIDNMYEGDDEDDN